MASAPQRLQGLTAEESLWLLGSVSLGRVVFTMQALPAICPVNHIIDGKAIIIRSHLGAEIVSKANSEDSVIVAYEADDLDPDTHLGWSVIVTGPARIVRNSEQVARYQQILRPWVAKDMDYVIRIQPDLVTGFRIVPK